MGYYDTNIKNNKAQNGINEVETNNDSFKDENDVDNNLLNQLDEVNNEIKSVNKTIESYSNEFQEEENKYSVNIQKLRTQEEKQNSISNVLLYQPNLRNRV